MTAYVETRRVAHVMEWSDLRKRWEAKCAYWPYDGYGTPIVDPKDYQLSDDWPLIHANEALPSKPWCSRCVRQVRHEFEQYIAAGILGETPE